MRNPTKIPSILPLLLDLVIEPLIRWLNASHKGYIIAFYGLQHANKWFADDGTLVTNLVEDMTVLLVLVDRFNTWSGIQLNIKKWNITAYIHDLQGIPLKRGTYDALRDRLQPSGRPYRLPHPRRTPPGRLPLHCLHNFPVPRRASSLDVVSTKVDWQCARKNPLPPISSNAYFCTERIIESNTYTHTHTHKQTHTHTHIQIGRAHV